MILKNFPQDFRPTLIRMNHPRNHCIVFIISDFAQFLHLSSQTKHDCFFSFQLLPSGFKRLVMAVKGFVSHGTSIGQVAVFEFNHGSFPFLELLAVVLLATLNLTTTLAECEVLLEFFALFLKDSAVDFLILFHWVVLPCFSLL